jgi:hypothetical protein
MSAISFWVRPDARRSSLIRLPTLASAEVGERLFEAGWSGATEPVESTWPGPDDRVGLAAMCKAGASFAEVLNMAALL